MGIAVDTNVFINAENGRLDLDAVMSEDESFIAAITVSELLAGVHLAKTAKIRVQRSVFVERIIANVPVLDFNEEITRCYGELYALRIKSKSKANANTHDLQISATCIALGHSILTSNVSDYKNIPNLNIITPN